MPRRRRLARSVVRTYRSFVRSFVVRGGLRAAKQTKMSKGEESPLPAQCRAAVATP